MSASLAAVPTTVWTSPEATSTPICAFIPKCHWLPFFVWCISGSRLCCLFLVEACAAMIVASTIVPPACAGAGSAASAGRAPPASRRLPRTAPLSTRAVPANAGSAAPWSRPAPDRGSARCRQSRALPGCRKAHPPVLHRTARTIAAQNRPAACAPAGSAAGRVRPLDRAAPGAPPAGTRVQPVPSRPETPAFAGAGSVPPRLLLLGPVFRLGEAPLTLHRPAPARKTKPILPNLSPRMELFQCFPKQTACEWAMD
jgi:hypothetical protein